MSKLYPNEDKAKFVPVSQLAEIGEDFNEDDLLHLKVTLNKNCGALWHLIKEDILNIYFPCLRKNTESLVKQLKV